VCRCAARPVRTLLGKRPLSPAFRWPKGSGSLSLIEPGTAAGQIPRQQFMRPFHRMVGKRPVSPAC